MLSTAAKLSAPLWSAMSTDDKDNVVDRTLCLQRYRIQHTFECCCAGSKPLVRGSGGPSIASQLRWPDETFRRCCPWLSYRMAVECDVFNPSRRPSQGSGGGGGAVIDVERCTVHCSQCANQRRLSATP